MGEGMPKKGFFGQSILTLVACLFVFIALSGNGAVTPALNAMRTGLWSTLPPSTVSYIATLPSLFAIAGCLISGALAGKVLSWRVITVIAFTIYLCFGLAPAVFNLTDFYVVLVTRAGFGLGMGMLWPLGNALILRLYEDSKRGHVLGWGQTVQSLGGVLMQTFGGFFAAIYPQYAYYAYLIAALGLILALIGIPKLPLEKPEAKKEKVKIPLACWGFLFLLFMGIMMVSPILIGTSTIMAQRGFGGSAGAGIVTSMYTIGGACAGLVFGFSFKKLGKWVIPIGYMLMVVAMLIVIYASSAIMLSAGLFFAAFCFIQIRPSIYNTVGYLVTPAQVAAMIGAATAVFNFGNFMATYYIKASNTLFFGGVEAPENPIWVSAVLYGVMAVAVSVVFLINKNKMKEQKKEQ